MKVLIADDSSALRQALCAQVAQFGYTVTSAVDGADAVAKFQSDRPDLVLLDVEMPGMSGLEAAAAIRHCHDRDDWVPIVFLSSHTDAASIVAGIRAGGDDYLTKPIAPEVLVAKLSVMERLASMRRKLVQAQAELATKNEELLSLTRHDALTGIWNRRYHDECLDREFARALRQREPLALLILDVDHFKRYNDHYGHPAGDACLRTVAQAAHAVFKRKTDVFARYGGEEFSALLPATDETGACKLAADIRVAISKLRLPHAASSVGANVTVSIGCACLVPDRGHAVGHLVTLADRALYVSKERGRDRVTRASQLAGKSQAA
jgi:diguanylate cyclase (GGDEF)-like protein